MAPPSLLSAIEDHLAMIVPRQLGKTGRTQAAVIVPLLPAVGARPDAVLLIKRGERGGDPHSGQVGFPGGKHEPREDLLATAWREAFEEIRLRPEHCRLLGALSDQHTPTGYFVRPFVALVSSAHPPWEIAPSEVNYEFAVPLEHLRVEENWSWRPLPVPLGRHRQTYSITHGENLIWGLTARVLRELLNVREPKPLS